MPALCAPSAPLAAACRPRREARSSARTAAHGQSVDVVRDLGVTGRRHAGLAAAAAALLSISAAGPSRAFTAPPSGFSRHVDKIDGYEFIYPESWYVVTTSGNDVFYRNPSKLEENLFVDITSPSSSRFKSVRDLGTPDQAAQKLLKAYLEEFMSTRIGVKREGAVVEAKERVGRDGNPYYDVEVVIRSYATRNQLSVMPEDREQVLEWERSCLTTLGTANRRLYSLRLQSTSADMDRKDLTTIRDSFVCKEVA